MPRPRTASNSSPMRSIRRSATSARARPWPPNSLRLGTRTGKGGYASTAARPSERQALYVEDPCARVMARSPGRDRTAKSRCRARRGRASREHPAPPFEERRGPAFPRAASGSDDWRRRPANGGKPVKLRAQAAATTRAVNDIRRPPASRSLLPQPRRPGPNPPDHGRDALSL